MNFIEFESPEKLRGGFYTNPDIAAFLSRWVLATKPKSVLEPSCGDGIFLHAVANSPGNCVRRLFACEINQAEAEKAKKRLRRAENIDIEIHVGDFLKWFLFRSRETDRFDSVIGNPPFIRYQYLPAEQQLLAEKIFARFGLPFTKHTNAWVPFVLASIYLLAPGGRLAMVVPSEIFHIPHAQSLRRYLASQCSRIHIFDPQELWFDDALQGVVMLLAEKKARPSDRSYGVAVRAVQNKTVLNQHADDYFQTADYLNGSSIEGKWMPVFLSKRERSLLKDIRDNSAFAKFSELASVDVGIVTGANKFFLVTDEVVKKFGLKKWAHPMFGRSEHVSGIIYNDSDHHDNRLAGLPTNFLWFEESALEAYSASAQTYIQTGEREDLPKRFKCRTRTPWFRVPSVYASPVAMLKRAHNFPRLVLNLAQAFTTDTAYRIQPKKSGAEASLVYSCLNSLTCLSAELEGRHYGGGVLELVPSEIERLLIPVYGTHDGELRKLDQRFRSCSDRTEILREQDSIVLQRCGLSKTDCLTLHQAWDRLKNRRRRISPTPEPAHEISTKNGSLVAALGA